MTMHDPYVTRKEEGLHNAALIAWITYAVGLLTAWVTGPIGFIIAMMKKNDARGTIYHSHFQAIIRSGLIVFFGYLIGGLLTIVLIGWFILPVVWIYNVWVVVKGTIRLVNRQPYD